MAQVPEKVLAWLYSVLHEYHDPQRSYSDTVRTLSTYSSLRPRTEVYTYENGSSALLLTLSGTLPATFRGTSYRFPVKLWMPQAYPQEAPMAYVTPTGEMLVQPGQHVGVDGRVYHPYLRDWSNMWDRASIAEFLEFLQQVFAKEPPVVSKAQQQQYQQPIRQPQAQTGTSQAPPQLPPKSRLGTAEPAEMSSSNTPPPRPPKPGDEYIDPHLPQTSSRDVTRDGPPLPPLPHQRQPSEQRAPLSHYRNGFGTPAGSPSLVISPQQQGNPNARPPIPPPAPLRPQEYSGQPSQTQRSNFDRSPVSPVSPINGYSELPETKYSHAPHMPRPPQYQQPQQLALHPGQQYRQPPQQHLQPYQSAPSTQPYSPNPPLPQQHPPQQLPQPKKQPPPDLLSDPFDVTLSGPSPSGPPTSAPPIPPNPEKEHLLHALSTSLVQQAQQKVSQNLSAMGPLQAQHHALRSAHDRLTAEIQQLEALDGVLSSNEAILHRSIKDCDRTISTAKSKPLPPIDEVLVSPTMVANQLWTLCAEEAACREAMYVLQKAVDRGRVSANDFVRQMRSLGRERFLKMALARKCARGLGLEVNEGR